VCHDPKHYLIDDWVAVYLVGLEQELLLAHTDAQRSFETSFDLWDLSLVKPGLTL
jgi:hypothetical protein